MRLAINSAVEDSQAELPDLGGACLLGSHLTTNAFHFAEYAQDVAA
jgi:hypothetical protein